jgi:hypothetical protein
VTGTVYAPSPGLATGVLNLAIVVPQVRQLLLVPFCFERAVEDIHRLMLPHENLQIVVSLGAGPWDALYGGGNTPAFVLASVFSLAAGVLAVLKLPKLSNSYQSAGFHGFG